MPSSPTTPERFSDFDQDYILSLAKDRNWTYAKESYGGADESGLYVNPKTNTRKLYALQMMIDGLKCEYYTADFIPVIYANSRMMGSLASGDKVNESDIRFRAQVFAVSLPYAIENLYVESRTNITLNNILGVSSVIFRDSRKVVLEGDFNLFFRVYTPKDEELVAFTILAPNIMVNLLEDGGDYDFEFSGNRIYFYQTFRYSTPTKITLKKAAYDGLLSFGVSSAQTMARAARPTKVLDAGTPRTSMWQLYGTSNVKLVVLLFVIFSSFCLIFLSIVIPLLWPVAILLAASFYVRYRSLMKRRKRLVSEWHSSSQ
jgi:hypothetical protein